MELRHLRYFVAVADLGTVSRAAQQLNTLPAAYAKEFIADLEAEALQLFTQALVDWRASRQD